MIHPLAFGRKAALFLVLCPGLCSNETITIGDVAVLLELSPSDLVVRLVTRKCTAL